MGTFNIQSNAIRGSYRDQILGKTIQEIHDDVSTVFGPWARDAFITKDGQPYYTRDGLEVLESLTFDNRLSEYIRKMIYQAAYDQGKKVGDGTTTMIMMYTNLFRILSLASAADVTNAHEMFNLDGYAREIQFSRVGTVRDVWKSVVDEVMDRIKKWCVVPMTEERLLSMLYTCTQDQEFTAKVFTKLKDPLLEGAYIIPRKSNIESDLEFESYMNPRIEATRQFTLMPLSGTVPNTVIYHCNGSLDIAHVETLYGLATIGLSDQEGNRIHVNIVLLCNGITDVTRKTTKNFVKLVKGHQELGVDISNLNNVAIYTLDRYREMDNDTIEDLSTIITDEPGIGGLVNALTFESLLFQAFDFSALDCGTRPVDDLLTFDCDLHHLDKIKTMMLHQYSVTFDDAEGLRLHKELGPVAQQRYDDLRKEIQEEKSETRKYKLQKRLRSVYGQFIEVEVGSKLLKDSQRKFELLLDVIISAAEGVRDGVVDANSIVLAMESVSSILREHQMQLDSADEDPTIDRNAEHLKVSALGLIQYSLALTMVDMLAKYYNVDCDQNILANAEQIIRMVDHEDFDPILFNVNARIKSKNKNCNISEGCYVSSMFYYNDDMDPEDIDPNSMSPMDLLDARKACVVFPTISVKLDDETVEIPSDIVEPVNVIKNILENSILSVELFLADTYHVDGFLQNYL